MPTKDDLTGLDTKEIKEILKNLLTGVCARELYFAVQQVYELSAVIMSIESGQKYVKDKMCNSLIVDWFLLLTARNTLSHNLYNKDKVIRNLTKLYESTVLLDVCREALGDETLSYPIYYLIGDVLRTGELFL